eukprot:403336010
MEKYKILSTLGQGSFGKVFKAVNTETNQVVAIKQLKQSYTWEDAVSMTEIKSLRKLNNHANVIKIIELIRKKDEISIVMEFCDRELFKEMQTASKNNKPFSEIDIKIIMGQAISAINYLHKNGFMHRDIKPENFLLKEVGQNSQDQQGSSQQRLNMQNFQLKLADFGTAKDQSESSGKFTDYVGTRWYRAPELLLKSTNYTQAVDMFSLGCLMLELYLGIPAFPGLSESDQLVKIFSVLGTPTQSQWPEGYRLGESMGLKFSQIASTPLSQLIKREASDDAIELMLGMLKYDANQRFTASQCLNHPYFREVQSYIIVGATRPPIGASSQPLFRTNAAIQQNDDLNQSFQSAVGGNTSIGGGYVPSAIQNTDQRRMSRYGAFNMSNNLTQPTLPIGQKTGTNLDESFKNLNDSSYGIPSLNNKPYSKPIISNQNLQNKNYSYQHNQFGNSNPPSQYQTPLRDQNQNRKLSNLNLGSSLIQTNTTSNAINNAYGNSNITILDGSQGYIPSLQQNSKTYNAQQSDILTKEFMKQQDEGGINTQLFNTNQANSRTNAASSNIGGGGMASGAYNSRLANNQRRAFIPDYATGNLNNSTIQSPAVIDTQKFNTNIPKMSGSGQIGSTINSQQTPLNLYGGYSSEILTLNNKTGVLGQNSYSNTISGERQGTASENRNNRIGAAGGSSSVFQGMASRQIINSNKGSTLNTDLNSDFGNGNVIPTFGGGRHRI